MQADRRADGGTPLSRLTPAEHGCSSRLAGRVGQGATPPPSPTHLRKTFRRRRGTMELGKKGKERAAGKQTGRSHTQWAAREGVCVCVAGWLLAAVCCACEFGAHGGERGGPALEFGSERANQGERQFLLPPLTRFIAHSPPSSLPSPPSTMPPAAVPETALKKRTRDEAWATTRAEGAAKARAARAASRKDAFKRAESYVKEYRAQVRGVGEDVWRVCWVCALAGEGGRADVPRASRAGRREGRLESGGGRPSPAPARPAAAACARPLAASARGCGVPCRLPPRPATRPILSGSVWRAPQAPRACRAEERERPSRSAPPAAAAAAPSFPSRARTQSDVAFAPWCIRPAGAHACATVALGRRDLCVHRPGWLPSAWLRRRLAIASRAGAPPVARPSAGRASVFRLRLSHLRRALERSGRARDGRDTGAGRAGGERLPLALPPAALAQNPARPLSSPGPAPSPSTSGRTH